MANKLGTNLHFKVEKESQSFGELSKVCKEVSIEDSKSSLQRFGRHATQSRLVGRGLWRNDLTLI